MAFKSLQMATGLLTPPDFLARRPTQPKEVQLLPAAVPRRQNPSLLKMGAARRRARVAPAPDLSLRAVRSPSAPVYPAREGRCRPMSRPWPPAADRQHRRRPSIEAARAADSPRGRAAARAPAATPARSAAESRRSTRRPARASAPRRRPRPGPAAAPRPWAGARPPSRPGPGPAPRRTAGAARLGRARARGAPPSRACAARSSRVPILLAGGARPWRPGASSPRLSAWAPP